MNRHTCTAYHVSFCSLMAFVHVSRLSTCPRAGRIRFLPPFSFGMVVSLGPETPRFVLRQPDGTFVTRNTQRLEANAEGGEQHRQGEGAAAGQTNPTGHVPLAHVPHHHRFQGQPHQRHHPFPAQRHHYHHPGSQLQSGNLPSTSGAAAHSAAASTQAQHWHSHGQTDASGVRHSPLSQFDPHTRQLVSCLDASSCCVFCPLCLGYENTLGFCGIKNLLITSFWG